MSTTDTVSRKFFALEVSGLISTDDARSHVEASMRAMLSRDGYEVVEFERFDVEPGRRNTNSIVKGSVLYR